jgi:hypothetical protein
VHGRAQILTFKTARQESFGLLKTGQNDSINAYLAPQKTSAQIFRP